MMMRAEYSVAFVSNVITIAKRPRAPYVQVNNRNPIDRDHFQMIL